MRESFDHPDALGKSRRPRWTPSADAKALLETIFSADAFPTFAVRSKLAGQLGIDTRQVQIWFQNRRQRERIKTGSSKDDEDRVNSDTPDTPDEDHAIPCWSSDVKVQLPGGKQLITSSSASPCSGTAEPMDEDTDNKAPRCGESAAAAFATSDAAAKTLSLAHASTQPSARHAPTHAHAHAHLRTESDALSNTLDRARPLSTRSPAERAQLRAHSDVLMAQPRAENLDVNSSCSSLASTSMQSSPAPLSPASSPLPPAVSSFSSTAHRDETGAPSTAPLHSAQCGASSQLTFEAERGTRHSELARRDETADATRRRDAGAEAAEDASYATAAAGGAAGAALSAGAAGARRDVSISAGGACPSASSAAWVGAATYCVPPPPALVAIVDELPKDANGETSARCAAPSLLKMLQTPGGSRALQVAARNMLRSNRLFQHPNAPCHELLTQLAGIMPNAEAEAAAASAAANAATDRMDIAATSAATDINAAAAIDFNAAAAASAADAGSAASVASAPAPASMCKSAPACAAPSLLPLFEPAATMLPMRERGTRAARLQSNGMQRRSDISTEALEVLSSQFFYGGMRD